MSMSDTMLRIGEIQATLVQVSGGTVSTSSTKTTDTSSASTSALFAEALAALGGTSATVGTIANPTNATGTDVVASAAKYLGVPYVFGGEDSSGMDCSGLVQRVYADLGIAVPRLVSGQMTVGTEVGSLAEAKPGDLIVTEGGDHILIYAGNNKVIHAPYEGRTVSMVDAYMTDADIVTIRRIIPTGTTAATAMSSLSAASSSADLVSAARAALVKGGVV